MNFISVIIILLIFLIHFIWVEETNTYTAAIVSYHPTLNPELRIQDVIDKNTEKYIQILDNLHNQLDIIIYPEATLDESLFSVDNVEAYTTVPSPDQDAIPCKAVDGYYPAFFKRLSCAAKRRYVYMVINLVEKEKCDPETGPCASYGYNLYNTNVVFDRKGMIVARYRKYNLFGEQPKNKTAEPEHSTFTTDFGVTFGLFTCFDILFRDPPLELVKQGVKDFIFPTMWFSELPFLTALQTQEMWSEGNNVILLASGANHGSRGSGGSGIYIGNEGPLVFKLTSEEETFVTVTEVPKDVEDSEQYSSPDSDVITDKIAKDLDRFKLLQDEVSKFKSEVIDLKKSDNRRAICHGDGENELCCNFDYVIQIDKNKIDPERDHYTYHMVAFSGQRSFAGVQNGGIELCGIVACLSDDVTTCGKRFQEYSNITWPITFEHIKIQANYQNVETKRQFPNSLLSSLRPIHSSSRQWTSQLIDNGAKIQQTHILNEPQDRLFTFGIYGRDFNRDTEVENPKQISF